METSGPISVPDWLLPKAPYDMRPALDHPDPFHWQKWRDAVWLEAAGYCQWCHLFEEFVEGHMEVHHLTYKNWGKEETQDGTLLCSDCHKRVTLQTRRLREAIW